MGVLLSVLVACVGVFELFSLYNNIRYQAVQHRPTSDLPALEEEYVRQLEDRKHRLILQLKRLKEDESFQRAFTKSLSPDDVAAERHNRTLSSKNAIYTEEPQKIHKSKAQECLPEFLTQDHLEKIPEKLVTSEDDEKENRNESYTIYSNRHNHKMFEIDGELYYKRSPSPFPDLQADTPKHFGNTFVENCLSVTEVNEAGKSKSPSPLTVQNEATPVKILLNDEEQLEDTSTEESENEDSFNAAVNDIDKTRGCIKKKLIKKRRLKNRPASKTPSESSRKEEIKTSENVEQEEGDEDDNTSNNNKAAPEPFWLIFSGEYTKAMNKDWHGQHFCCWQCDESLTGQRYVLRDEHPYCVSCYESVFANACEKCSRIIGIDSKDLSYKDKHWHEACFLCTTCGESLVDKQFGSKGDRIYCGRCYDEQFASRCDGCHEIFRAGTKKMEYKTRQWHEKCFCCCVCKVPIGTQSFIPREQEIYCAKCYEDKYATRCIKCNKVITSGGVTYKNEPWHRECFTCTNCQKSLAGERFTSRDEKPYCAECFGELFAKRCFACNRPITGIGGTKFISFEDRHWHNDCFFCASCRTSLVGRGFITDQDDIICPECAKQKLM
ncbi:four and a half LIM domains protein limpet isoform X1 [Rhynchophorus ferrugineus]|uniref:four and a half LIM domains protein limpet isoform X1 n=1 Tax=Rhynchophorus ferrugineus TaxID=354439 RepID=UPI003FCE10C0